MNKENHIISKTKPGVLIGSRVRLRKETDVITWNVTSNQGIVLGIRKFGPIESMVTARFGNKRIHISDTFLEIIDG